MRHIFEAIKAEKWTGAFHSTVILPKTVKRRSTMMWLLGLALLSGIGCRADYQKTIEVPVCDLGSNYTLPHFYYCDRYFSCIDGFVHEDQCADGFAYEPLVGCIYSHFVDCTSRPYLQPPISNGACWNLNGIFPDKERGCNFFYECVDGFANMHICNEGLVFDEGMRRCREPNADEASYCFKPQEILQPPMSELAFTPDSGAVDNSIFDAAGIDFRCPENALYTFGDNTRYPYPGKCRFYIICWKNGKVAVFGCPDKTAYNPLSFTCEDYTQVPHCRDGQS